MLTIAKIFRAFRFLCEKDFCTPAELSKLMNAATSNTLLGAKLFQLLNAYPEIFLQSAAHVFLNPAAASLVRQLLPLADNVEVVKCNR